MHSLRYAAALAANHAAPPCTSLTPTASAPLIILSLPQRRAYHFLPGCKPELAHLHLLFYQVPESALNSGKGKPGPKKRELGTRSLHPCIPVCSLS